MAAALSGMFTNQPPGPPPPPLPPGGPGQAGLLPAAAGPRNPNSTLVDELEASFEACFASLVSQDYVNGTDQEEIRTGVDQCIQKFLDVARQTECFFLQKRLHLSVQKPELVIKEACTSHLTTMSIFVCTWEMRKGTPSVEKGFHRPENG
ncbi:mediator of RNA polymerase II transcription subunit 28 isoform X2 [Chelonia mydas]|uniref:mediator of RNA polymerase II transcription subunit 28 isoform X2 n=1 Tax=Chelonia mydas TaxID=8469 RepID=UPI0018A211A0|nr:mediator of RNA polymerase II transcription subunit 28 isoform X2 [Chelonia mydas]